MQVTLEHPHGQQSAGTTVQMAVLKQIAALFAVAGTV